MAVSSSPFTEANPPLRPPESDYDRLFNLSLDLLCVAGLDGYFKRVNPSWTRILGWTEAELLARPVKEFMHPDDRERTLQAREGLARGTPVRGLENRYLCKDGTYRWLSWQSISDPGAALVFAVARDVTERRQLDHERLVMSKLESTGILAGGMAHDFNNLLASLLLNVEMVGLCGPTTAQQGQFIHQALKAIETARVLTGQLITFAGSDGVARRTSDLRNLLREAFELALQGAELRTECVIAPDLWPVRVNQTQITQVFRGLLLNAREATPRGGEVRVCASNVTLAEAPMPELAPGDYLRIRITDTGGGIPAEILPKIFDPYFSTKERGTQKGMGLGLTICRMVLKRHGGAISIESETGRGTTVTCHLPAAPKSEPRVIGPVA